MLKREDLVFATCYQLAQLTSDDWDDPPSEVSEAIRAVSPIDEPGEISFRRALIANPLSLTGSETEPYNYRVTCKLLDLKLVSGLFKIIMKYSDGWETKNSDIIKKEIVSRISDYEKQIKEIVTPVPDVCYISVQ